MDFIKSFGYALTGLWYILKTQRNARIHLVIAIAVLLLSVLLQVSNEGLAAIFIAILLVFLAEIINTAFEKTLDLIDVNHRPEIKIVKDMVAGAVLVASVGAVIIGLAVFRVYILELVWRRG